jgi:hypothetical protein
MFRSGIASNISLVSLSIPARPYPCTIAVHDTTFRPGIASNSARAYLTRPAWQSRRPWCPTPPRPSTPLRRTSCGRGRVGRPWRIRRASRYPGGRRGRRAEQSLRVREVSAPQGGGRPWRRRRRPRGAALRGTSRGRRACRWQGGSRGWRGAGEA